MRDAVRAQCLQDRGAGQDRHPAPIGVRQNRRLAAPIGEFADAASGERQQRQGEAQAETDSRHPVDRLGGLRGDIGILRCRAYEIGIGVCLTDHLIAAADIASERQRRQQQAVNKQCRPPRQVPALSPQPIMDTNAGVGPYRYQRNHLHRAEPRPMQPLGDKDCVVIDRNVQRALGYACADDVKHQQKRNA